jgi:hypothetical protein
VCGALAGAELTIWLLVTLLFAGLIQGDVYWQISENDCSDVIRYTEKPLHRILKYAIVEE